MRRALRWAAALLIMMTLVAAAGVLWLRGRLTGSLPLVGGTVVLAGLQAPVRVETDALGIPAIHARSRSDLARATGFLHAQDRFFQMDLLRRAAAGELAELLGAAALPADRAVRLHRLRDVARRVAGGSSPGLDLITAYADGVNSGLAALRAPPFEYVLLRSDPRPWSPEDCVLVSLAMFLDLHDERASRESALGLMRDLLPPALFEFLAPRGTEWDAPILGGPLLPQPIPGPHVLDLRAAASSGLASMAGLEAIDPEGSATGLTGSNSWAVAGSRTSGGRALLANDMHLGLRAPNIWYRASFEVEPHDAAGGAETGFAITGATLPGAPAMVVGSNGHVAWGFTNSHGDWSDLVEVEVDPADPESYRAPEGPRRFEHHHERIRVKGGAEEVLDVVATIWGPIVDKDHRGRARALRWTAHDDQAVNMSLARLESARSLDEAVELATLSGIPPQNIVIADSSGRIGWTIAGAIPRRSGHDGSLPASWADGARRWDGYLSPAEHPRIVDPPSGLLWTANARVVDGQMLAALGDGGYDLGARASQIRDGLRSMTDAGVAEMLALQLDDRALFLSRWRELLLSILDPAAVAAASRRGEARRVVEAWGGRASIDSAGYRVVRTFRQTVARMAFTPLTAPCAKADSRFAFLQVGQWEGPLWQLVTTKPIHLLDPAFTSWDTMLLAALDATLDQLLEGGGPLEARTWGERNTVRLRHPLSAGLPWLGRWLDSPARQLPGDSNMPRVQSPQFGASQRMVVSPGHEPEGIFHMPGGQSGHPLSPHYADAHDAWAAGEPTPFLPGQPVQTLILSPDQR